MEDRLEVLLPKDESDSKEVTLLVEDVVESEDDTLCPEDCKELIDVALLAGGV